MPDPERPLLSDGSSDPDDAADAALGGEFLSTLDPLLLIDSLNKTVTPEAVARAHSNLMIEIPALLAGFDGVAIPPKDFRFQDAAFQEDSLYRRWAKAYLAWEREMMSLVDNDEVDWRTRERSRLLMGAVTTAMAPTNFLAGNPAAIKQAMNTGGRSLIDGAANFLRDLQTNGGLPAQVDKSAFRVGVDVAATPGWVIHRTEMFELIHFTATAERVGKIPLLLLPPPVNKYYFWDLAPGRSLVEYAIARGVDVYTIVWRDPKPEHGSWGIDSYLAAALEAVEVAGTIARSGNVHIFGDCSGGMFLCMLLAHQEVTGRQTIRTGTMGVTVVDFGEPGGLGITASDQGLKNIRQRAEHGEIISAESIANTFVWMRPNDLIWRYLVDEWLMGKKPPAFDIMFWNADGQGLTAQLALEMTEMSLANSLIRPGGVRALGEPIDLAAIQVDTYHIAGRTDHISPWKACYAAVRILGGERTFVLTPTGHVQSIIYPSGKPNAAFFTNPDVVEDSDAWVAAATKHDDSWWPHWVDWLLARSDGTRKAPTVPGKAGYQPIVPAPGRYVLGE